MAEKAATSTIAQSFLGEMSQQRGKRGGVVNLSEHFLYGATYFLLHAVEQDCIGTRQGVVENTVRTLLMEYIFIDVRAVLLLKVGQWYGSDGLAAENFDVTGRSLQ